MALSTHAFVEIMDKVGVICKRWPELRRVSIRVIDHFGITLTDRPELRIIFGVIWSEIKEVWRYRVGFKEKVGGASWSDLRTRLTS